jgi:hypothetical protein
LATRTKRERGALSKQTKHTQCKESRAKEGYWRSPKRHPLNALTAVSGQNKKQKTKKDFSKTLYVYDAEKGDFLTIASSP